MKTEPFKEFDCGAALAAALSAVRPPGADDVEGRVVKELCRGRVIYAPKAGAAEKGDRITIRSFSSIPRFSRERASFTLGGGLFSREIEEGLLGLRKGDSFSLSSGGSPVTGEVLEVEGKDYPALEDSFVEELGLEGIRTLREYRSHMDKVVKEEYASAVIEAFYDLVPAFSVEEGDVIDVTAKEYLSLEKRFGLEAMDDEEWKENFGDGKLRSYYERIYPEIAELLGTVSRSDFFSSRRASSETTLRRCLVLRSILSLHTKETDPTLERYALRKLEKEMNRKIVEMTYGGTR